MSRYYLQITHYPLVTDCLVSAEFHYGFDRLTGYFYQVYLLKQHDPLEECGAWRQELTGAALLERIETLQVSVPEAHRHAIARDQPF